MFNNLPRKKIRKIGKSAMKNIPLKNNDNHIRCILLEMITLYAYVIFSSFYLITTKIALLTKSSDVTHTRPENLHYEKS